jgi:hypothetical protein
MENRPLLFGRTISSFYFGVCLAPGLDPFAWGSRSRNRSTGYFTGWQIIRRVSERPEAEASAIKDLIRTKYGLKQPSLKEEFRQGYGEYGQ